MSGQDINPFASPEDVNPFADTTQNKDQEQKNELANEFNPFEVQQQPTQFNEQPKLEIQTTTPTSLQQPATPVSPKSPATIEPTWEATPGAPPMRQNSSGFKGYGSTTDPMQERQEELEKKAADLERREAELRKRAAHGDGVNNFPPLPKCCCVGPCFYHDISMDIPIEHQRSCRMVFFSWQLYVLTLFMNVVSALGGVIEEAEDAPMLFGIALLYFLLFPIMSFACWYRPLYKALRSNSSFNFMCFFFVFGAQIILMFIYALGINSMGTCGWINAANVASANLKGVSVMYFLTAAMFTLLLLIYVYLIRRDPSVTAQTKSQQQTAEYNPFDQQKNTQPPSYSNPSTTSYGNTAPATIEPETAPSYQKPFAGASTTVAQDETMRRRQEELERKAAELDKKEQDLKRVQTNLPKENNFPPLPKFLPCTPCFYHDISADIPIQSQRTCKMVFYVWQLYVFTLLFNFICALALLCDKGADGGVTFGVSLLYLIIFPPMSFLFWYRPLYKALRNDSSFNYFLFFFTFFFQVVFCGLYAIGIPAFGSVGWINGAKHADSGHPAVASMMFVCAALFTLLCILKILLLRKIHGFYRSSGASLQKAQTEFATGVASNQHVQTAAAEAVKAGVNQQVQQHGY